MSPEYFATLSIPLLKGRLWDQSENRRGDFVAVINQTLAARYWAKGDAIGHQIRVESLKDDGAPLSVASAHSGQQRQIIGIVADSRNDGLEHLAAPAIYVPYTTFMWDGTQLFIRTSHDPLSSLRAIRSALHADNAEQRVTVAAASLEDILQLQPVWTQQRLFSVLFSCFALLALVLSLVGLGSTLSFAIAQRRSELGIRIALGAQRTHIIWIVSKTSLATVGGGIMVGLLLNSLTDKALGHFSPESISSPQVVSCVAILLLICAATTSLLLSVRAANVNPSEALRSE